ncbi:MAG: hypothetical protein QOJ15_11299 [Bradyrhizobium sp.]|nr:hypothetical protein [Bradyrhizobium sp.]
MPAERVPMRSVREILRLKAEGLSDRAIARSTRLARSTVSDYAGRAVAAGLSWPLPEGLTDTALEALLFVRGGPAAGARRKPEPDWAGLHRELRRPGVTLMLLWQEYRAGAPEGYGYSRFCELYDEWESRLSPVMRQVHPAGERLFVDYAGQTIELVDGRTGEVRTAQIFVAVLGASSYTYAEASWTQTLISGYTPGLVHIRLDQARIDRKRFAADQPRRDTRHHHALKYPPQGITLTKALMPCAAEHRMIGNPVLDVELAKPPVRKIDLHLGANLPLRSDRKYVTHEQHPDHQHRIDRRSTGMRVVRRKLLVHPTQIENGVDLAH